MIGPYVDLLPWVVFAVVVRRDGLGFFLAAVAGAATGLALVAVARRRARPAPFAQLGAVWFLLLVVVAAVARHDPLPDGSARAASALVLGLVALLSLRRTSVAAVYLADQVPPAFRRTAGFERLCRRVTGTWGVGALVLAAAFAAIGVDDGPTAVTLLAWVVPVLVIGATMAWTNDRSQSFIVGAALDSALEPEAPAEDLAVEPRPAVRHRTSDGHPALRLVPGRGAGRDGA